MAMKSSMLLAAVAIAAVALPAGAAPSSGNVAADRTQDFAKCAVKQYDGAELLATQPGSPEEAEVLAEFGRRGCAAPSSHAGLLRGAVAEQLFKADFGAIGSQARRDLIEVFTVDVAEIGALDAASRRQLDLLGFGTCVAAADPVKAVGLLQTSAGSAEEARIVAELQPKFSPCLMEGEQLSTAKSELRGALAEGAYRLALAHALDGEIVVTGTRDPARSVLCKTLGGAGTHLRHKTCLTAAQWKIRDDENRIAAADHARRTREAEEQRMTVEVQQRAASAN
jgi:hypothetical protein